MRIHLLVLATVACVAFGVVACGQDPYTGSWHSDKLGKMAITKTDDQWIANDGTHEFRLTADTGGLVSLGGHTTMTVEGDSLSMVTSPGVPAVVFTRE